MILNINKTKKKAPVILSRGKTKAQIIFENNIRKQKEGKVVNGRKKLMQGGTKKAQPKKVIITKIWENNEEQMSIRQKMGMTKRASNLVIDVLDFNKKENLNYFEKRLKYKIEVLDTIFTKKIGHNSSQFLFGTNAGVIFYIKTKAISTNYFERNLEVFIFYDENIEFDGINYTNVFETDFNKLIY